MELNQWSIKLDDGEIYMIQRGNMEDLLEAKEAYMKRIMGVKNEPTEEPPMPTETKAFGGTSYSCNECGSKAEVVEGTSKKGNHYKGVKCTANKDHFRFLSE